MALAHILRDVALDGDSPSAHWDDQQIARTIETELILDALRARKLARW